MIQDQAFGAVVICKTQTEKPLFLLIKQAGNYWAFPKGHREGNETALETAKRELLEETGLTDVNWQEQVMFVTKYIFQKDGEPCHKTNTYFLAMAPEAYQSSAQEQFAHEVLENRWAPYLEARELLNYPPFVKVLDEANDYLARDER